MEHLIREGREAEARRILEAALTTNPETTLLLTLLGQIAIRQGDLASAADRFSQAIAMDPASPAQADRLLDLGWVLHQQGKPLAELHLLRRAWNLGHHRSAIALRVGSRLMQLGQLDESITLLAEAVTDHPDDADLHHQLGIALYTTRTRVPEAMIHYQRAFQLRPDNAEVLVNLAFVFRDLGQLDQALAANRLALTLQPELPEALASMGILHHFLGDNEQAVTWLERALDRRPDYVFAERYLLEILLYLDWDPARRLERHRRFGRRHESGPPPPSHGHPADLERPMRIGYLSALFIQNAMQRNLLPVIEAHDRNRFQVVIYADVHQPDAATERFRNAAALWRPITGMSDDQVARLIRQDNIDLLVILAGRFDSGYRPGVCGRKPAPILVSYHDPGTSGMSCMDYLLTDRILTPRHGTEGFTERLFRLPGFYVIAPIDEAPPVSPLPFDRHGVITFGCFNHPSKLNLGVLELWASLLTAIPGSRLLLKYRNLYQAAAIRERIMAPFREQGVADSRISMVFHASGIEHHLAHYGEVDIALDPFPFGGATTSFEALWMGVPIVTLLGTTMVGRWSASLLHSLGMEELIALDQEGYLRIAGQLAVDLERLRRLRVGLRPGILASGNCDISRRTRQLERAYRGMIKRR